MRLRLMRKRRAQFAGELGFCPVHMWQLHEMSSAWGESIGFPRLFEHISELLERAEPRSNSPDHLARTSACRVCKMLRESEVAYVLRLRDFLSEPGRQRILQPFDHGVCLRHLGQSTRRQPSRIFASFVRATDIACDFEN